MTEERRPRCPSCDAPGIEPRRLYGRTTYRYEHDAGCRIAAILAGGPDQPRTEHDYLGGMPRLFEPADYTERGITR